MPSRPATCVEVNLPARILGTPVQPSRVVQLLESLGVEVSVDGDRLTAVPPTWRPDLRDPYDYVEEVGRLVGYETIEPVVPRAPLGRGLTRAQRSRRAITTALAGRGHVEVLSFPFASHADLDKLRVPAEDRRRSLVRILNPLAETSPYLRTTLLPGLFAAAARNVSRGNDDLALYETGSVFFGPRPVVAAPRPPVDRRPDPDVLSAMDTALAVQPRHCAVVLAGYWRAPGWRDGGERVGWPHAVAFVEVAADAVGAALSRRASEQPPWHPGRCAEIILGGAVLGHAGELHPEVCEAFGLPARTCAAEFDLDALVANAPGAGDVAPISGFPVAKEDVALVVDAAVPAAAVEAALREGAGPLCESVRLFDIYTGPQVGPGKKSLAFALRFRAGDRTLTEAEAGEARDGAVRLASERLGAVQRIA